MFIDHDTHAHTAPPVAAWQQIRAECLALPEQAFAPWVQREMHGSGWSVYGFHAFGRPIPEALRSCPHTAAALARVPGLVTAGYSRLAAGAWIKPHVGWVRTVYRAHLGLVVPADCALRVGGQTRAWPEGGCLVFDDTVEHEAWNRSSQDRFVLLFDFLRPGASTSARDVAPAQVRRFVDARLCSPHRPD